jgi:hypothetical protein
MARLWLDDRRKPPWGYDLWAKTADQAIQMLQDHAVEHVSLDHDLAEEHYGDAGDGSPGYGEPPQPIDRSRYRARTGYAVLEWMRDHNHWIVEIHIHTLNSRAADDMLAFRKHAPPTVTFRRVKPWEIA